MAGDLWHRDCGASGVSTEDPKQALIDECQRQYENCNYTAVSFIIWLKVLRSIRTVLVVAPIAFGALATWKLLADNSAWAAAVFTLLTTAIPPAYRASRLDASIDDYTQLAGEFTNLRDRFRQAAWISSHKAFADFEADAKPLIARLEKARSRALTPPNWCFKRAQRTIKADNYTHDYDLNPK
jgi:hypothetical protein